MTNLGTDVQTVVARARCYSNTAQAALELSGGDIEAAVRTLRVKGREQPEKMVINHLVTLRGTDEAEARTFYENVRTPYSRGLLPEGELLMLTGRR